MGVAERSDLIQTARNLREALVFGFGGLASSLIFSCLVSFHLLSVSPLSRVPFYLLWPGLFFLAALSASFAICRKMQWISIKVSSERFLIAAMLVISTSFCAMYAGLFGGVATALLLASPTTTGRGTSTAHTSIWTVLPVVFGLIYGVLVAALLICLALYILTKKLDRKIWIPMMLFGLVLAAATIVIHPGLFGTSRSLTNRGLSDVFEQTVLSLHVWGQTFYGACAGYWLARSDAHNSL